MSLIAGCLSSLSYYLCCGCCFDTEENPNAKSSLISNDVLQGGSVDPSSPSMNGHPTSRRPQRSVIPITSARDESPTSRASQGYGSLGESPRPEGERLLKATAERVAALTEYSPSPLNRTLTPHSPSPLNRTLTPPGSPGSESEDGDPFNWQEHAVEHKSPLKQPSPFDD